MGCGASTAHEGAVVQEASVPQTRQIPDVGHLVTQSRSSECEQQPSVAPPNVIEPLDNDVSVERTKQERVNDGNEIRDPATEIREPAQTTEHVLEQAAEDSARGRTNKSTLEVNEAEATVVGREYERKAGASVHGESITERTLGAAAAAISAESVAVTDSQPAAHVEPMLKISRPIGFKQIYNDRATGAKMDGSIWKPVAPEGYVSSSVADKTEC
jgi:hypothetical protein